MTQPRTQYAQSGGVELAYQVFGVGEHQLKGVPDLWTLYAVTG
jgi:hypothetical protein